MKNEKLIQQIKLNISAFKSALANPIEKIHKDTGKRHGKFYPVGYYYLPTEIKKVCNELKIGDKVTLVPDPNNQRDPHAIKVMFSNIQIGWYAAKGYRQNKMFDLLMSGKNIDAEIISNNRGQTQISFKY